MSFSLTIRLGITPEEGAESAYEFQLDLEHIPSGITPVFGEDLELPGLVASESLVFKIDFISPPDEAGVIHVSGFRWEDDASSYHYWRESLTGRGADVPTQISTDEVSTPMVDVSHLGLECTYVNESGNTCLGSATSMVVRETVRNPLAPRCDDHRGRTWVGGTGQALNRVPRPLVASAS